MTFALVVALAVLVEQLLATLLRVLHLLDEQHGQDGQQEAGEQLDQNSLQISQGRTGSATLLAQHTESDTRTSTPVSHKVERGQPLY